MTDLTLAEADADGTGECVLSEILSVDTGRDIVLELPMVDCMDVGGKLSPGEEVECSDAAQTQALGSDNVKVQRGVSGTVLAIHCCDGSLTLTACPTQKKEKKKQRTQAEKELEMEENSAKKGKHPGAPAFSPVLEGNLEADMAPPPPQKQVCMKYERDGHAVPSKTEWDGYHRAFQSQSIKMPCQRVHDLPKDSGFGHHYFEVCDYKSYIYFDKVSGVYEPYLKMLGEKYWLVRAGDRVAIDPVKGFRAIGCCIWELDSYHPALSKNLKQGKPSDLVISWVDNAESALTVESCTDFGEL